MAARGTAVVPTLVNVENFPGFAAAGEQKFPTYASTMRRLYASSGAVVRAAYEAGVPVFTIDVPGSRGMADAFQDRLDDSYDELSMGMSHDFEVAIEEGATLVTGGPDRLRVPRRGGGDLSRSAPILGR